MERDFTAGVCNASRVSRQEAADAAGRSDLFFQPHTVHTLREGASRGFFMFFLRFRSTYILEREENFHVKYGISLLWHRVYKKKEGL